MWVSAGLQRALTSINIKAGFFYTVIWPLDAHAVDRYLGPSQPLSQPQQGDPADEAGLEGDIGTVPTRSHERMSSDDDNTSSTSDDSDGTLDDTMAALLAGDLPKTADNVQHYFVPTLDDKVSSKSNGNEVLASPSGASVSPKVVGFWRQCHLNSMPCKSCCA